MTTDSETTEQYLTFVRNRFLISVIVFVSRDYELGTGWHWFSLQMLLQLQLHSLGDGVVRRRPQSRTWLIFFPVILCITLPILVDAGIHEDESSDTHFRLSSYFSSSSYSSSSSSSASLGYLPKADFRHQFFHLVRRCAISFKLWYVYPLSLFFISREFCIMVFHFASFLISFLPKCLLITSIPWRSIIVFIICPSSPTLCKTVSFDIYSFQLIFPHFLHIHISIASRLCISSCIRHHVSDAYKSTLHMNTLIILFQIFAYLEQKNWQGHTARKLVSL